MCPPYYYTPSHEDIFHHFRVVSDSVDIGIVIYNTWWTAPNIGLDWLERLAELEHIVGLKWSAPSVSEYHRGYERLAERLAIVDNADNHVYAHMQGAVGWITHVSNFWPQHDWEILDLLDRGEYRRAQDTINRFNAAFAEFRAEMESQTSGEGHAIKHIMELVGLVGGPSRPPTRQMSLTPEQRETLRTLLQDRVLGP